MTRPVRSGRPRSSSRTASRGRSMRKAPCVEIYLTPPERTPPAELLTGFSSPSVRCRTEHRVRIDREEIWIGGRQDVELRPGRERRVETGRGQLAVATRAGDAGTPQENGVPR